MPLGPKLNRSLISFIERQKLFFVATAAADGRVNLSPKGGDSLKVMDEHRLLWLNLSGSGNETAGHIKALNRITLMFCAFEGDALILRVYGTAKVIHPRDPDWDTLAAGFAPMAGSRQIFDVAIDGVQTSCGTGVPILRYEKDRVEDELLPFYDEMGADGVRDYWQRKNTQTIDGLPTGLFED
ncbi:MAG: pyridoxamine 5'-phosphate oxidase family protein [Pseudomonadota bacterium]